MRRNGERQEAGRRISLEVVSKVQGLFYLPPTTPHPTAVSTASLMHSKTIIMLSKIDSKRKISKFLTKFIPVF